MRKLVTVPEKNFLLHGIWGRSRDGANVATAPDGRF
jgi:hypothetical protein